MLELLSAGEQNEWWGLGFWVVQGMLGNVGFNWQLGSLATGRGQGTVNRVGWGSAGRLVRWKQGGVIFFFFSTHQTRGSLTYLINCYQAGNEFWSWV